MRTREVLTAGLLVVAIFAPALARGDEVTRSRVQDALDATDRRISIAQSFVGENPNALAQLEVTAAQQGQARARASFASSQYMMAMSATLAARDHADRAVAIVRNLPDPDRVQSQVGRTREVLDRARDRLDACDNARARGMLHVALAMQDRAEGAMTESRYLAALQLTMSARERVLKAMRLCNIDDTLSDSATRALQRTDEVLARAQESLDPGAPQSERDLLGRARSIQVQAQTEARLQRFESALRMTQDARALAERAIRPARAGRRNPGH